GRLGRQPKTCSDPRTVSDNWTSIFQTFGLFMALAFLSAAINLNAELRRKESMGLLSATVVKVTVGKPASPLELLWNAIVGFFIGFKALYIFQNFEEFKANAPDVILSGKGEMLGGIVLAAVFVGMKYWEKNKEKLDQPREKPIKILPSDRTGDITVVAAITGLLGAKIFALIETPQQFLDDPIGEIFSGAGLAIYGGLIGGAIGVIGYLLLKKIPVAHFADAVAPGLMLSYGVGRMGCQLSGDGDWGIPVTGPNRYITDEYDLSTPPGWMSWLPDWFWAYDYPHNVNMEGIKIEGYPWQYNTHLEIPVLSTPLWEITAALFLFGVLWALRKRIVIPGMLFCVYLIFNGMERFWIEKYRVNDKYDWLPFSWTQAELIAVMLMVLGVVLGLVLWQRSKKKTVEVKT
ncbi:MAG: prolipoprotein diacylglyceryl transferase family protein, partial [Bacteroidota bacterium]